VSSRSWIVVHSQQKVPSFYRLSLRFIGLASPEASTPTRTSDEALTVTFVPEEGVELQEIIEDLSNELTGLVVGIVAEGDEIEATVAEGGQLSRARHPIARLVTDDVPRIPAEPDAVVAARALCGSLGIGFSSEEAWRLPPGGWGLASQVLGRGKVRLPEGWIDQQKERFLLGPGRDVTGDPFLGIWDRTAPDRPIMRFAENDREQAFRTYLELRSGKRGDDR
jgi:hypothetical protein